jgi:hypothetical protein
VLTVTSAATSAAIVVKDDFEITDSGEREVCGLPIEYDFEANVRVMIRQGPPGTPTEFWSWQGSFREVITNPENGEFIVITGRFNDRDVSATLIEDDTYLYRFQSAGSTFVVTDSDGKVVYRENGLRVFEVVFDHGAPEGERVLSFELVAERGFPGYIDDLCAGFLELMS